MLGFSEVTYTYATAVCDWPGCDNRINLQPGPEDPYREKRELKSLRGVATRHGWSLAPNDEAICPYHAEKETA